MNMKQMIRETRLAAGWTPEECDANMRFTPGLDAEGRKRQLAFAKSQRAQDMANVQRISRDNAKFSKVEL